MQAYEDALERYSGAAAAGGRGGRPGRGRLSRGPRQVGRRAGWRPPAPGVGPERLWAGKPARLELRRASEPLPPDGAFTVISYIMSSVIWPLLKRGGGQAPLRDQTRRGV